MAILFQDWAEVYIYLTVIFGPLLIAILGFRRLIRRKKRSLDPRVRCGIGACRLLFCGLSLVVIWAALELYQFTLYPNDMFLADLVSILWGIPLILFVPLAILTWIIEIIWFKTRPMSRSRPTPFPSGP